MVQDRLRDGLSAREREILFLLSQGTADKEVARQLHLSLNTVKWHNRQIYAKLGVTNRTQAVAQADQLGLLGEEGVLSRPEVSLVPNNLPAPVSSFVGRTKEMEEINHLLQDHRLVTLTGPGGVGKTRLALEIASSWLTAGRFPDGIYFVELAPISDPARVGEAVLEAVGLKLEVGQTAKEKLVLFLKEKDLLLLWDNFEHLLEGAPLVAELLKESPDLKVLATSREALHLSGEQTFLVPSLEIDPSRELFLQRAREVRPDFELTIEELPIIDRICARLDCLPLAIELAAARLPLFSLKSLLESLEDRFQVLTAGPRDAPERHQTLWDAIDWSYQLLSEEERILFRRLAVFQGSRTIDAVQEICCFDLELIALEGLASLLVKNLIRQEEGLDGEARFYLLETTHAYASEKLFKSGKEKEIRERHARYFMELVAKAKEPLFGGPDAVYWRQRIETDFENIRLAHDWTIAQGEDLARIQMNGCLAGFWYMMGHHQVGKVWVESALAVEGEIPLCLKADLYLAAGRLKNIFHHWDQAVDYCQQALNLFLELGDKQGIGRCHITILTALERTHDIKLILEHFQAAVEIFEEIGDKLSLARAWTALGAHYVFTGNIDLREQAFKKSLSIALKLGDEDWILQSMVNVAGVNLIKGNANIARQTYLEVLDKEISLYQTHGDVEGTFELIAEAEAALGHFYRAVVLLGAGNAFRRRKGISQTHWAQEELIQRTIELTSDQLDQDLYQEAWEEGQKMGFEEAVSFAQEQEDG